MKVSTASPLSVGEMAHTPSLIVRGQGLGFSEITQTWSRRDKAVPKLMLDNSDLKEFTDWVPEIDMETGLLFTLEGLRFEGQKELR